MLFKLKRKFSSFYFILNSLKRVKFKITKLIYKLQHRFQIFRIVGVNSMTSFFEVKMFSRLQYFRIRVFLFSFSRIRKKFSKEFKLLLILNCLMRHETISEKAIVYGCSQDNIKLISVTFVVYGSEI